MTTDRIFSARLVPTLMVALALLAGPAVAGGAALDLDGASFSIPLLKATTSGKSKGVGKGKGTDHHALTIHLANHEGTTLTGTFTTELDGEAFIAGTWSRSGQVARKLQLELVAPEDVQMLEHEYESTFEESLLDHGVVAEILLALVKQKGRLTIALSKKAGTARAILQLKFRFEGSGTAPAHDVHDAFLLGKGRLKGKSESIDAAGLLVTETEG